MRILFHRLLSARPQKPKNPLLKMAFSVLGLFLLFGVCVFAIVVGVAMLIAGALLRLIGRKTARPAAAGDVIDAEYAVVDKSPAGLLR
ncbi:hypothetical protein GCM10010960_06260 [Arenimonas maotaiensis]|uniref:Uncharacterized protein n=1 Tax=Arenimonas maotaiensis TaxID=1446479 RepID=A0A917CHK4_9GAMM|nr:hypothetical protein [Arenimonas maotaiensis]GGF87093.1 hypothetical protein GCM10010960_06260 [Arenimonas maotaiensis]